MKPVVKEGCPAYLDVGLRDMDDGVVARVTECGISNGEVPKGLVADIADAEGVVGLLLESTSGLVGDELLYRVCKEGADEQ